MSKDFTLHPTAIVDSNTIIGSNSTVGPYCVIGPNVKLGSNVKLHSHVCIDGDTTIGNDVEIFPFAVLGYKPQDLKYNGEKTSVIIGSATVIREHATIHSGTASGIGKTVVGSNCLIMVGCHIAHDCIVGNSVIIANNAQLAGHVEVGDGAILGGMSAYHQFVRVGAHAIVGGGSMVSEDIIPYGSIKGDRAYLAGLNLIGMRRKNIEQKLIAELQTIFNYIFKENLSIAIQDKLTKVKEKCSKNNMVCDIVEFISSCSKRPICMPKNMGQ